MRRDQLEHAIRTACQIIGQSKVIVIGEPAVDNAPRWFDCRMNPTTDDRSAPRDIK